MFNLKNLAIAVSVAFGLTACGDNNDPRARLENEAQKRISKLSRAEQIEDEITKDVVRESLRPDYHTKIRPKIQKKVFELFPANNVRMERNEENCLWYINHGLVPAWTPNIAGKEDESFRNFTKAVNAKRVVNDKEILKIGVSYIPEYKELLKKFFFTDGKLNIYKVKEDRNVELFYCALTPEDSFYYFENKDGLFFGNWLHINDEIKGNRSSIIADAMNFSNSEDITPHKVNYENFLKAEALLSMNN